MDKQRLSGSRVAAAAIRIMGSLRIWITDPFARPEDPSFWTDEREYHFYAVGPWSAQPVVSFETYRAADTNRRAVLNNVG